jgi:hypothetical protein
MYLTPSSHKIRADHQPVAETCPCCIDFKATGADFAALCGNATALAEFLWFTSLLKKITVSNLTQVNYWTYVKIIVRCNIINAKFELEFWQLGVSTKLPQLNRLLKFRSTGSSIQKPPAHFPQLSSHSDPSVMADIPAGRDRSLLPEKTRVPNPKRLFTNPT